MSDANPNEGDPILSELMNEDSSFEELVAGFVDRLSDRVAELEGMMRTADFDSVRLAAHRLRGSGGGYGYPIITAVAAKLEKQAASEALDDCIEAITELRSIAGRVQAGFPGSDSRGENPSTD